MHCAPWWIAILAAGTNAWLDAVLLPYIGRFSGKALLIVQPAMQRIPWTLPREICLFSLQQVSAVHQPQPLRQHRASRLASCIFHMLTLRGLSSVVTADIQGARRLPVVHLGLFL